MLRKTLVATVLLAASTGAMADDYVYGRVVKVEPNFVISFSSGGYNGYRILYEVGGRHYWTHSHRHPGHVIWVPRPVVYHVYHHNHHHKHDYRHDWKHNDWKHNGWRDHDRWKHHGR